MNTILSLPIISIMSITFQRQLIHEKTANRTQWFDSYDYIVCGAGSAGAVAAHRLAASGKSTVLLLEAGKGQNAVWNDIPGLYYGLQVTGYDNFWHYSNVPQASAGRLYKQLPEVMGKVLGGGSSVNSMYYSRGSRYDYDHFAYTYGAHGWAYTDVLPLFVKIENNSDSELVRNNPGYHGTQGRLGVSTASDVPPILHLLRDQYNSLGFKTVDLNGETQIGTSIIQTTIKDGLRCSSATAYIDPNPYPNNLHILTESHVKKVLFMRTNDTLTASAVEFVTNNASYEVKAKKEIIVSAGPINTPQILLLSGIGPKAHLNELEIPVLADLPVGDNYVNHVGVPLFVALKRTGLKNAKPELNVKQLAQLYKDKSGPLAESHGLYTYMNGTGSKNPKWPSTFIHSFVKMADNNLTVNWMPFKPNSIGRELRQFMVNNDLLSFVPTLIRPRSKGTIRLISSDPFEHPLIDPQFLTHPQDMEDLVEAVKYAFFVIEATPFAQYVTLEPYMSLLDPLLTMASGCLRCRGRPIHQCEAYVRCYVSQLSMSIFHPTSSCRMGDRHRNDVVVDHRCRVKNVSGLRVSDSSIYPDTIAGNTNAASILAGEKCSQFILEDWP